LAFEAAEGLTAALALCLLAFEVGPCARVDARLRDRDPMQGAVELTVAAAVEAVAPTGAPVEMTGTDVYEFAGDLISRVVTETDTMPLLRQIGAVPAPQPTH
jgi:hypothetical protein